MPTKNPRLNVTFEPRMLGLLTKAAAQEHKSLSSFAKELILEALERREDIALSAIAASRDKKTSKVYSHEETWK